MPATVNQCPYALRVTNKAINELSKLCNYEGQSHLQVLSNVDVQTNTKHWIPFGRQE